MNEEQEKQELKHEPMPGYRAAFTVFFALALFYLLFIAVKAFL
ncbi:MAG: hypothetical protein OEW15_08015 [Nitrospirota bacterium]|nr:hypothetical protein [Nitrospirota bacterium]